MKQVMSMSMSVNLIVSQSAAHVIEQAAKQVVQYVVSSAGSAVSMIPDGAAKKRNCAPPTR